MLKEIYSRVNNCSVLQAIQSRTFGKHYILLKILLLHHYLTVSNLTIHFLWVPSHNAILGNETADCFTKSVFRSNNLAAETKVGSTVRYVQNLRTRTSKF